MKRFYVKNKIVPFEEDHNREFKNHKAFVVEDIPPNAVKIENGRLRTTHQPISRAICSFLNTGKGGTVYLGIDDDGYIRGIPLTFYQVDHVNLSITNMMSRYTPPVRKHQYTISFVEVLEDDISPSDVTDRSNLKPSSKNKRRQEPHVLQTHRMCWCDSDAKAVHHSGILSAAYVIELCILPWDKEHSCNMDLRVGKLGLHPVYQNEEGKCFYRKQGSVQCYTLQEVMNVSIQETKAYYEEELEKLCLV